MEYRILGNSLLNVSRIAFGCMSLPVDDEKTCGSLLHQAIDKGINFFDTADLYNKGLNEAIVGKALKEKRKEVIIASKVGNQWRKDGSGWDWNASASYILSSVEKSLQRLQTDYIDLYQLHGGMMEDNTAETIAAFETLKQQGKIRFYGISSIRPTVIREYVSRSSISSVMLQYSVADRRPEETVLPLLEKNNIGILARGVLAQGLLVNKPAKEYLGHDATAIQQAATAIKELSTSNRTPAQTALLFALQQDAITSVVAGISNETQLQEICNVSTADPLPKAAIEQLHLVLPAKVYEQHR